MPVPSIAIIDTLNSLIEAEINSIFHFVGPGSPYVMDAAPDVRDSLAEIVRRLDGHTDDLVYLIRQLGGKPSKRAVPSEEDKYLSFLSLKFLLPKLVDAKKLMIRRYESALPIVANNPQVVKVLDQHIEDMLVDLEVLRHTTSSVAVAR